MHENVIMKISISKDLNVLLKFSCSSCEWVFIRTIKLTGLQTVNVSQQEKIKHFNMYAHRKFRSACTSNRSGQRLCFPPEQVLAFWLPIERIEKILIRLSACAHACHNVYFIVLWLTYHYKKAKSLLNLFVITPLRDKRKMWRSLIFVMQWYENISGETKNS